MTNETTPRGFQRIIHTDYPPSGEAHDVVQQSSAIGDYDDSLSRPGTSFLWIGDRHHLDREEVAELRNALTRWLETGKLFDPATEIASRPHPEISTESGAAD